MEHVSSLNKLIYNLHNFKKNNDPILSKVSNFNLLISSLQELESMVEMDELKDSIAKQVKFLLVNSLKDDKKMGFDGHMLHTVIYGPPGVGKTDVCKILVKIWLSMGILNPTPSSVSEIKDKESNNIKENINEILRSLILENKIKEELIYKLQERIVNIKNNLSVLDPDLEEIQVLIRKLKRTQGNRDKPIKSKSLYDNINQNNKDEENNLDTIYNNIEKIRDNLQEEIDSTLAIENIKFVSPIIKQIEIRSETKPEIRSEIRPSEETKSETKSETKPSEETKDIEPLIQIVGRDDFVGGFLGQSALKTEKLLRESLGKVLFIDEAYCLVNDEQDSFGREALTVLNRFMSEHSDELIVIFAGYKELMQQTIFKFQPGLKSRCTWSFEIKGYTEMGLSKIFQRQLNMSNYILDPNNNLINFFKKNILEFPAYGRDTNKLLFYCKMCHSEAVFDSNIFIDFIDEKILNKALNYLIKNRVNDDIDGGEYNSTMYM